MTPSAESAESADDSASRLRSHLRHLADLPTGLPESHKQYLLGLKASGFEPRVVYDIGSSVLHWAAFARQLWPAATFVLFDAFQPAEFLYQERGFPLYHIGVLSDRDGRDVRFYQNDLMPAGSSYYREVGCKGGDFFPADVYKEFQARTLDGVVAERGFPPPDLVKIDVQGAERDVIHGAGGALDSCQRLIVEMQRVEYNEGAPRVHETMPVIEALGFRCEAPLFSDNGPDGDYGFVREGRGTGYSRASSK